MANDRKYVPWKKISMGLGIGVILLLLIAVVLMSNNASVAAIPGAFEMRVQTQDGQSAHVLYGDDIESADGPISQVQDNGTAVWGVPLKLTDAGAQKFRQACIDSGAASDPQAHNILIILDNRTIYAQPLAAELAKSIPEGPVDQLMAMTGTGDQGKELADTLVASLRAK